MAPTTSADAGSPTDAGPRPGAPPHAMGIPPETKEDLLTRLSRIGGQVQGLARMIEDERYCPEVLQQFGAARSALRSVERLLLANHLDRCATRAIACGGEQAERVREEIVELFSRYMK